MPATTECGRRWRRVGWFVLLYCAGLAATAAVLWSLKALIPGS
jgi:hypothetical protein